MAKYAALDTGSSHNPARLAISWEHVPAAFPAVK